MSGEGLGIRVDSGAEDAVREASSWLVWFGRFGYAAKGIVYVLVGFLAAYSASGSAAGDGTRSALRYIVTLPLGQFLLGAVAFGLVGYALWRLVQAFMDTEKKGSEPKGIVRRAAYAAIAIVYIGLAFSAVKIILGERRSEGVWAQSWTAWILGLPLGQWLVALAGAGVIAVGLYQFYRAYSADFREKLLLGEMTETEETWATRIGRFGHAARGVVFCIVGPFLVFAAYQADAAKTRDFGEALRTIEQQPFGPYLLALVGAGFVSYGLFMFVLARYRRMVIT
ncbi:MAG TPA: DUF1206 domain-containing protein [Pyrinomonadaceae bacterium]